MNGDNVQNPIIDVQPLPGMAPPNVPQPSQPGGGDPPSANPEAAALAPPGTVPVAVFPPFIRPRTYPAICVIFSELTKDEKHNNYGKRRKHGIMSFPSWHYQDIKEKGHHSMKGYGKKQKGITMQRQFGFRCRIRHQYHKSFCHNQLCLIA